MRLYLYCPNCGKKVTHVKFHKDDRAKSYWIEELKGQGFIFE